MRASCSWFVCATGGTKRTKGRKAAEPMEIDRSNTRDANDRLHSWKEIAVFLGHGVRTVQRWELERALPVHRTPGGKLGSVFAFKSELVQWMTGAGRDAADREDGPASSLNGYLISDPLSAPSIPQAGQSAVPAVDGATPRASGPLASPWRFYPAHRPERWRPILTSVFLMAVALPLVLWLAHTHRVAGSATRVHVPEPAAVDLYLQGRYFWEKRDPADLERAVDLYTQAIVRDPQYAEPYAGLANCYNLLREFSTMPPEEAYPRSLAAASRAIQLDRSLAEAHASLAFVTFYWKWDPATADREFQRAIALKPDLAVAHHWYANTLMSRHRTDEALRQIQVAQQLDPSSTAILGSKGLILIVAGREDEGRALLQQLEATQPDYLSPHVYLAGEYLRHREAQRFLAEENFIVARTGSPVQAALAAAAARGYSGGGYDAMLRAMLTVLEKSPQAAAGNHVFMGRLYALLGRPAQALQSLEIAYINHEPGVYALHADPPFDSLHSNREFQQMAALDWHPPAHPSSPDSNLPAVAASSTPPSPANK